MLPLLNTYLLVGLDDKKPIAYSLACGLAEQLDEEVVLIDSGEEFNFNNPYDNLKVIKGGGWEPINESLRLMNHYLMNYDEGKVFVLNPPKEFMMYLYKSINSGRLSGLINLIPGLVSKRFRSRAFYEFKSKKLYSKFLLLITDLEVPSGLTKKYKGYAKNGWLNTLDSGLVDKVMVKSLMLPILSLNPFKIDGMLLNLKMNQRVAYYANIMPYNIRLDDYDDPTIKHLITPKNIIYDALIKDNLLVDEYQLIYYDLLKDLSTNSLVEQGKKLVTKDSLKPISAQDLILRRSVNNEFPEYFK